MHCHVADHDWYRARLTRLTAPSGGQITRGSGPVAPLIWRPWLIAAGVSWGLACGTKWEAVYPMAAFGIMTWLWSAGARRSFGVRGALLRSAVVDGVPAFFSVVGVALVVYVASWSGWLVHAHQYEKDLSSNQYTQYTGQGHCDGTTYVSEHPDGKARWPTATEPDASGPGEVIQSLRSLWYYHQDVYTFHTDFLNCSTHIYASKPSGWLLLNRPVGVDADTKIQPGTQGCDAPAGSRLPADHHAAGHTRAVVGWLPWPCWRPPRCGWAPGTGGSASPWSAPCRPGCRGCSTTTGRSSASTPSSPSRSWCWRSPC